ncbi:gallidermin/nisin family lantibiotic [Actinoplanes sp. NPDC051859]|uniref:gallidermin/nisin family lantibiotic n=1 Tax=Actinoplanes sp. NPDC051859 TaxID=3363909 RepID=UPI003794D0FB
MSIDLITQPQTDVTVDDLFDLDVDVNIEMTTASPMVTSWSLCTPGCTSEGGGSQCSFCC